MISLYFTVTSLLNLHSSSSSVLASIIIGLIFFFYLFVRHPQKTNKETMRTTARQHFPSMKNHMKKKEEKRRGPEEGMREE